MKFPKFVHTGLSTGHTNFGRRENLFRKRAGRWSADFFQNDAAQSLLDQLSGAARRQFMASIVKAGGKGAASMVEREMGRSLQALIALQTQRPRLQEPRRVAKSKPLRKIPETAAIFDAVHRINRAADADPGTIRLSIDTKTTVAIGNLSRGGKSRQAPAALDHDLEPEGPSRFATTRCPNTKTIIPR